MYVSFFRQVAVWHDESHLNRYFAEHPQLFRVLPPSFLHPQGCGFISRLVFPPRTNWTRLVLPPASSRVRLHFPAPALQPRRSARGEARAGWRSALSGGGGRFPIPFETKILVQLIPKDETRFAKASALSPEASRLSLFLFLGPARAAAEDFSASQTPQPGAAPARGPAGLRWNVIGSERRELMSTKRAPSGCAVGDG